MPSVCNNSIASMPPMPPPLKLGKSRKCKYNEGQCIWVNGKELTNIDKERCNQSKAEEGKCKLRNVGGRRKTRRRKTIRRRK